MTASNIENQVDNYLPLLSINQQELVLGMIKSFLNLDNGKKRISQKQYNKEIQEAIERIENGVNVTHLEAINELQKW